LLVSGRLDDALAFSARILPLYYALAHEGHGLSGGEIEAEGEVKGFGLLGNRMHDDASDTDGLGGMGDAHSAVAEQGAAEPLPCCEWSIARRPSTATGIGSGMLRRNRPTPIPTVIASDARA
jgi:hypothetical protein